jgi:hypothetical protein
MAGGVNEEGSARFHIHNPDEDASVWPFAPPEFDPNAWWWKMRFGYYRQQLHIGPECESEPDRP